jgi:N-acetylglucosamine-6-phosphate deacetylase
MSDIPGSYTGPGLVDIQVNGYAGVDFNGDPAWWSGELFAGAVAAMAARGVAAALPTLITDDSPRMLERARRYAEIVGADAALAEALPLLHVEGPFISPVDGPRGAHPKGHCKLPAGMPDFIDRLRDAAGGRVGVVTLAPELPGAIELIERLASAGICPAIGHTQACSETLNAAVAAGARLSTHLGNGSHQELPRLDNYVQTQLADDRLRASFIADGHHMPFGTLKNFIRAKTPARGILVTDAISAAEMAPGEYALGGGKVVVRADGRCTVPGADHLAGSTLTLDRAVLNVAGHCGVGFAEAWRMASVAPAELVGLKPPEVTVDVSEGRFIARRFR